jgi:D-glycero-D-manno-heptose 1,7-bisphosphate phosphatase
MSQPTRAVFLDRDGTIIEDAGYLDRLDRVEIFPWSVDAIRLLNRAGFTVVVVSNQAGVARGLFDESVVGEVHRHLDARMAAGRARIDAYYYCPHHPEGTLAAYRQLCECRKPRPGMIRAAERDLGVDAARSFVVGDRWLDVEMGRSVGASTVLVRTGYGAREEQRPRPGLASDAVADNLIEAVAWILGSGNGTDPQRTGTDRSR